MHACQIRPIADLDSPLRRAILARVQCLATHRSPTLNEALQPAVEHRRVRTPPREGPLARPPHRAKGRTHHPPANSRTIRAQNAGRSSGSRLVVTP